MPRKSRSPGCYGGEAHMCSRNCINHDEELTFEEGKMAVENCDDDVDGTPGDLDHSADADALEVPDFSGDAQTPRSGSAGAGSSEDGPSPRDMSPSGSGRRLTVNNADGAEPAADDAGDQPLLQADGPSEDQGRQDSGVCGPWASSLHRQPPTRARSRSRSRSQGHDRTLNRSRNGNCDLGCDRNRGSSRSRSRSPIRRRNLSSVRRGPDRAGGGRMPQSRAGASGSAAGPAAAGGRQKVLPGPRIGQGLRGDVRPSSSPPPATKQRTYQRRHEHPWDGSAGRPPGPGHAHEIPEGQRPTIPCRGDGSALAYKNRRGGRALEHADVPSGQRGWGPGHAVAPREPRPRSPAPVHGMRHPDNPHHNHHHHRNRQDFKHQHQHERRFVEQQPTYAPGPGGGGGGRPDGGDEFNAAWVNGAPPRDLPASVRGGPFRGGGDFGPPPLQAPPLRRGPSPPPPPPPPPQPRQRSGPENQMWEYARGPGPLADPALPPDMGTDWGREPRSPGAMSYREKGPYMEDRGGWVSGPAPGAGHQRGEDRGGAALMGPSSGPGSDYGPRWAPPHLAARIPLGFRAPTDRSGPSSPQSDPRGGERFPESGRYRRGPPSPPPPPPPRRHSGGGAGGGSGPPGIGPGLHGASRHAPQEPRGGAPGGRHGAGDGAWAHNGRRSPSPPPHRRHGGSDLPGGPTYVGNTGPFRRPVSPYRSGLRSPQSARWEAAPYSAYDGRTSPPHDPGFIGRPRSPPAPMYGTQGSDRFIVDDGRDRGPAYLPPSPPQMRARLPPQESNDPRDGPAPSRHRGMRSPPRHFQDRGPAREYSPLPPGAAAAAAAAAPPPAAAPRFGDLNSRNSYERRRVSAGGDEPSSFELASYGRGRPPHIRRPLSPRSFDATLPDAKRRGSVDVSGRGERGPGFEAGRCSRQSGSPRRTAPPNPGHPGHANFRDGMEGKGRGCVSPDRHFGHGRLGGGLDPDPVWDRRNPDHGNHDRRLHHARSPPLGRRSDRGDQGAPPPHVGGPPTHGLQHASEVNRNSMHRSSADGGRMYGADGSNRSAAAATAGGGGGGGSGHTARSGLHASGVTAGQMGATNVGISAVATVSSLHHDEAAMVWFYIDPMGQKQGPCSIQQFRSWLKYLGQNAAFQDDYEKFRTCSVWKDPQHQHPHQHQQEGGRDGVTTRDGFSEKRTTTLSDLLQSLR
ncbi:hypothetical protein Vretimale_19361 [Volvox reticuliferus]|nr:hypothetical protein Vretimale_19361 [Volvox reticuliferus]